MQERRSSCRQVSASASLGNTTLLYDLGQHILEVTKEGDILITVHTGGPALVKESVQLDQDETYRLFLVLREVFL